MSGTNSEKGEMERGDEKEKRLRRPRMQKKEVADCNGRKGERATEKRDQEVVVQGGGGEADRGEEVETGGVKSGDLQVQLEQPVTLMVH